MSGCCSGREVEGVVEVGEDIEGRFWAVDVGVLDDNSCFRGGLFRTAGNLTAVEGFFLR